MVAVQVTVELQISDMPDDAARELARLMVEGRGLEVSRVAIKAQPDGVKVFTPKAGKPGSIVVRDDRAFQVWAEAPERGALWLVPTEPRDGDLPVYKSFGTGRAYPHHSDGTDHRSTWRYVDGQQVEVPCAHKSHEDLPVAV